MGDRVKQTFRICLVFKLVFCVLSSSIYQDDQQLYEGSPCTLAGDRGNGTCVRLFDCPAKIEEIRERRFDPEDRCGFVDDTIEIVCCSRVSIADKLQNASPAETACHEYENEVSQINEDSQINESHISFLILEGQDAKSGEFPSMVALGYAKRPGDDVEGDIKYTCGGTLISRQHVLTAAHCVSNIDEEVPIKVRLGSTDLTIDENTTQYADVLSAKPHPAHKRSQRYHDIAIIKLRDPVRLTSTVRPACLLTKPLQTLVSAIKNDTLVVTGWGVTEFAGLASPKLQKAVGLRFVDLDECSKSYSINGRLPTGLNDSMICAIDSNRTRQADSCQGDSGGPLLVCSGTAQPLVAGVTAFGQACGGSTPSVYTSVASYLGWIESEVWPDPETESAPTIF